MISFEDFIQKLMVVYNLKRYKAVELMSHMLGITTMAIYGRLKKDWYVRISEGGQGVIQFESIQIKGVAKYIEIDFKKRAELLK